MGLEADEAKNDRSKDIKEDIFKIHLQGLQQIHNDNCRNQNKEIRAGVK